MKKPGYRFLPGFLLLSLLSACGAPGEQALLDDARANFAAGKTSVAMIQLKNLLRADPDNIEARLLRGDVALTIEDGATAEQDLLRAEELGVDRATIVVKLGQAMMLQGAFENLIAEIHGGIAADEQTRLEIFLLRGKAYLALGKLDNAGSAFREALEIRRDSPEARIGLSKVALAQDDIGNALTEMARAVSAGPESRQVWIANGQIQLAIGNAAEAKRSFQRAVELKPVEDLKRDGFSVLNGLFQSNLALDEMDQALAVAEQALEVGRGHPLAHYLRGLHALRAGNLEIATNHLLETLATIPRHLGALSSMGTISLQQGKLKEADVYLRQAMALDRNNPAIRMQLAQTMLRLNEAEDALELLAPSMRKYGDVPELLALAGRASAVSSSKVEWLEYFEQAATADPADLRWQFELAQAYVAAGQADKSFEVLERIPDSAETSDRRDLIKIAALRQTNKPHAALDVAKNMLARNPDDAGIRLMLGQLHLETGDLNAARVNLESTLAEDRNNIPALLTLGQVEVRSKKLDAAESLFREAYNKQPNYLPTVTLLVALAQSRHDTDEAIEWLKAARLTNPVSVIPRVGLVSMYLAQDKVSLAYDMAREAVALEPNDPRALAALGMTQIRREEYSLAAHTLEKAAAVAPKSGMIRFQLSRAHHGINHMSDARRALKKAVELSPWRPGYAIAAVKLELSLGQGADAAEIADELIRQHPDNAEGYSLMGKALMLQDQYSEAAAAFASAVEKSQQQRYVMQLFDALAQSGDENPQRVLEQWTEQRPQDWRVRTLFAQALHSDGKIAEAIEQYEVVLQHNPKNTAVINNLAWLHADTNPQRALDLAQTVHELEPYVGTFTDTLGWMLILQGELDSGLAKLRQAAKQAPDNEEIRYHLAAALAEKGEVEEARLLLTQLINSGKAFDSELEARSLLQTL